MDPDQTAPKESRLDCAHVQSNQGHSLVRIPYIYKTYLSRKKSWGILNFAGLGAPHKLNFPINTCLIIPRKHILVCSCLFVLRFYGPVNPMGSCRARSVYLTTRLLGRLSPLRG